MSEILDRDVFEAYVYHAKHAERLIRHDAALRLALVAAEARIKHLELALCDIADSPTNDSDMVDVWTIARQALAGQKEKP